MDRNGIELYQGEPYQILSLAIAKSIHTVVSMSSVLSPGPVIVMLYTSILPP